MHMRKRGEECGAMALVQRIAKDSRDQDSFTVCGTGTNDQARGLRASDTEHSNGPCAFLDVRDVPIVAREQKGRLIRRMATCDGPLACHALQTCIKRYVSTSGANRGTVTDKQMTELEEWLKLVFDTTADCLEQVRDSDSTRDSLLFTQRVRCVIFLLQLCSTTLKTQRGASHPERAGRSAVLLTTSTNGTSAATSDLLASDGGTDANAVAGITHNNVEAGYSMAANACAEIAVVYLHRILQAATNILRKKIAGRTGERCCEVEGLGAADAVFWVLSLVSDVLKHFFKREWTCGVASDSTTAKESITTGASSLENLELASLAAVVASIPIERGSGMVDVALKWLEVVQLLVTAAEATSTDTLPILFDAVPHKLWRLVHPTGSLLPTDESWRRPGSALVEEDGADSALSQAMLRSIFRIIMLQIEEGSLDVGAEVAAGDCNLKEEGQPQSINIANMRMVHQDVEAVNVPWRSAVEALSATCGTGGEDGRGAVSDAFSARLISMFCDQDDALVDVLLINLEIYCNVRPQNAADNRRWRVSPRALWKVYHQHLHPATLFAALLSEVGFDSGVLMDWLISPETRFLTYLTFFLRFAIAEWSDFAAHVSGSSLSHVGYDDITLCPTEDNEDDEVLILSEGEAERLGRAMLCLTKLATNARDLEKRRLLPYNLAPLLKRIDELVNLYERCGDAGGSDSGDESYKIVL